MTLNPDGRLQLDPDTNQVIIGAAAAAPGNDISFYVSGGIGGVLDGGKDHPTHRGVSLFAGDVVISGSAYFDGGMLKITGSRASHAHGTNVRDNYYPDAVNIMYTSAPSQHGGGMLSLCDGESVANLSLYSGEYHSGIGINMDWMRASLWMTDQIDADGLPEREVFHIYPSGSKDASGRTGPARVYFLSGTSGNGTSPDIANAKDTVFYVSGNIAGKDESWVMSTNAKKGGISVFGGDLVTSGTLYPESLKALNSSEVLPVTASMIDIGWEPGTIATTVGPILRLTTHHNTVDSGNAVGTIQFYGQDQGFAGVGAQIIGKATATWGNESTDFPTNLEFHTSEDGEVAALLATMTGTGLNLASGKNLLCNGTEAIASDGEVAVASQPNITTLASLTSFGAAGATTNIVAGDLTMYNAVNGGNPTISLGSASAERLVITAEYDSGAQTLDAVKFATAAASGTANKGSFVFDVDGTEIFEITDSGIIPSSGGTFDLGSDSVRWANIYTSDLHLKNERGDWTVIEEEEYLSLRNNKTGKRYKFVLEEIDED
jgi:hypothetical protein